MSKNIKKVDYTMGVDIGDRKSRYAIVDSEAVVVEEGDAVTTWEGITQLLDRHEPMVVVIEAGTHSPWMSRLIKDLGHQVLVANVRKVEAIYKNKRKRDRIDAITLARLGRLDPELLHPIEHRGEQAQIDLSVIRSRQALQKARGSLITHIRGLVKSVGGRLQDCDTDNFHKQAPRQIPGVLWRSVQPLVKTIAQMTRELDKMDRLIERLLQSYPETERLRQVNRVGPITSLAYVLTLDNPQRFAKSRSVGPYLGMIPRLDESGGTRREGRITKEGDRLLRSLLVQCAHQILGPFGEDCDLRRFGLRLAGSGGRYAKKRAVVAVARKLAVLLHHLWVSGQTYDPLYSTHKQEEAALATPAS